MLPNSLESELCGCDCYHADLGECDLVIIVL